MGSLDLVSRLLKSRLRKFLFSQLAVENPSQNWHDAIAVEDGILEQIGEAWVSSRPETLPNPQIQSLIQDAVDSAWQTLDTRVERAWFDTQVARWTWASGLKNRAS